MIEIRSCGHLYRVLEAAAQRLENGADPDGIIIHTQSPISPSQFFVGCVRSVSCSCKLSSPLTSALFVFATVREGDTEKSEQEATTLKDTSMPDLCVICLEHDYNAVFVP